MDAMIDAYDALEIIEGHELTDEHGLSARLWEGGTCDRVYLTRRLSRGRQQEVGYIEIDVDGEISCSASRIRATVIALAQACGMEA